MNDANVADIDAALENCASEPVHIPDRIQENGALLAVDNETLIVTHASANLEKIIGIPHEKALGFCINDVFPPGLRHDFVNNLLPPFLKQDTRLLSPFGLKGRALMGATSSAKSATIFEFEPAADNPEVSSKAVSQIAFLTAQLQSVESQEVLFNKTVQLLQVLTGFRRVMVYEFDGDGNGKVQAEAISGSLHPFLGLSFPAWDIPQQARDIMKNIPFRYISNVSAPPVPVYAASDDCAPLDMTFSHLRGVSPVHIKYLENMGTEATLTLHVIVGGELWGIIALHHPEPRVPDQTVREVCRNFVSFFGLKLDAIFQRERLTRLHEADALRRELTEIAAHGEADAMFTESLLQRMCHVMRADGVLLTKDGDVQAIGLVPPPVHLERLVQFGEACPEAFHTSALRRDHPEMIDMVGDEIAGLHITFMAEKNFVAFFRRDLEQETNWAGAPNKEIEGQGADARLQPRGSFEQYKEIVRGRSTPWTAEQHQIANEVWSILVNAERGALIQKTTRQQKMLIDELNHRVRNILTLIRSLSRQSRSTSDTIDNFVTALESRIEAVATAHNLAVEKPAAYVSIRTILKLEAEPHNPRGKRVLIEGNDVGLRPDVAPIFALVVHELMTNAAKYGALSVPKGQLTITLAQSKGGLSLHWSEMGGPKVLPPKREGFGTILLENAVPKELGGTIDMDHPETGLVVTLNMPQEILSGLRSFGHVPVVSDDTSGEAPRESAERHARAIISTLLIEDSFVISLDTLRILNDVGFENVQTVMSVEDAEKAIKAELPEFAVLDVNLSGGDTSLDIARRLFELRVPFVFVTGYGDAGVPKNLFPGVPVLQKPMRLAALEQALKDVGV